MLAPTDSIALLAQLEVRHSHTSLSNEDLKWTHV